MNNEPRSISISSEHLELLLKGAEEIHSIYEDQLDITMMSNTKEEYEEVLRQLDQMKGAIKEARKLLSEQDI